MPPITSGEPPSEESSGLLDPPGRRWRRVHLVWMACALVAVALSSLWLGARIKSPAQAAADAAPPEPSIVTSPVVLRRLVEQVVVRGQVVAEGVDLVASLPVGTNKMVVTAVRASAGDAVTSGQVPIVLSGRPVIVLDGDLPSYRDLRPGDSGPDVAQLQAALEALGYESPDADAVGVFGLATQDSLRQLYGDLGFDPTLTSPDAPLIIANSRRAVATAQETLEAARDQRSAASSSHERAEADLAVSQAERTLEAAEQEAAFAEQQHGVMLPQGEVIFVPGGSAIVAGVGAGVGQSVAEGSLLMSFAVGPPSVLVELSETLADAVIEGQRAGIRDPGAGEVRDARVAAVEQRPSTDASQELESVAYMAGDAPLPGEMIGQTVEVAIILDESDDEVLAVPVTAVTGHADGTTTVSVIIDGAPVAVEVDVGLSAGGFVEVIPTDAGRLQVGDEVVVGLQSGT